MSCRASLSFVKIRSVTVALYLRTEMNLYSSFLHFLTELGENLYESSWFCDNRTVKAIMKFCPSFNTLLMINEKWFQLTYAAINQFIQNEFTFCWYTLKYRCYLQQTLLLLLNLQATEKKNYFISEFRSYGLDFPLLSGVETVVLTVI